MVELVEQPHAAMGELGGVLGYRPSGRRNKAEQDAW